MNSKTERNNYSRKKIRTIKHKTLPAACISQMYNPFEKTLLKNDKITMHALIKDIRKGLSTNTKLVPQNDYYTYINNKWLTNYKIPKAHKYILENDDFRLVQDKVYYQLLDIITSYLKTSEGKTSQLGKCIRNFYSALRHMTTPKQSRQAVEDYLKVYQEMETCWEFMGYICKNEYISWGCPIVWSLNPDDKEPTTFRYCIDSFMPTLIDTDLYFKDLPRTSSEQEYYNKYMYNYKKYLNKLFSNVFGADYARTHGYNIHDIYEIECELVDKMGCLNKNIKSNKNNYYRVYPKDLWIYSPFNWELFLRGLGHKGAPPPFFICSNPYFLKCCASILEKEWKTQRWQTYWVYILIRQEQRLTIRGHINFYEFNGNFVRGQTSTLPKELRPIYFMGYAFNTFLTKEYVAKYENPAHIQFVKNLADDLKHVFINIIENNRWLQPATKQSALKKLHHFNFDIATPRNLRLDPILPYNKYNPWENIVLISEWRTRDALSLEGRPVIDIPVIDWSQIPPKFTGTQAYVVNAAYTPAKNGIYIPLGYIQPPFVDLNERGIEYNLAHIGFTLAHEMSHSLDDWGSNYDYSGKLNNWWSDKDRTHYNHLQNDVVKQYELFAKRDGIIFNARPGIGEDLADISGLNICCEYLKDFLHKNRDNTPIKVLSFEAFFVYFAIQQRQKINKKALNAQLKTNPHPLDKYRTNVPLSRIKLFRILYKILPKDKMWWHSTNCIWN